MAKWLIWLKWIVGTILVGTLLLWVVARLLANYADFSPVTFGVSFSKAKAQALGLDWRETYLALLDDLKVTEIRLIAPWDDLERQPGQLDFSDLDWQLAEAEERGVRVLMALGYKLPGWPECHVPAWAKESPVAEQYAYFLNTFPSIINHLKTYEVIWGWQIENEPFFRFGQCPTWWVRKDFVEKEITIAREFDKRPIVMTESGEGDIWLKAAKRADIVGASFYRTIWNKYVRYTYPWNEIFYRAKGGLVKLIYRKPLLLHEVQMEPWTPGVPLPDFSLDLQYKTLSPERFRDNIRRVKEIGFSPAYLWGAEWWYWLKEVKSEPTIWEEAKELWR